MGVLLLTYFTLLASIESGEIEVKTERNVPVRMRDGVVLRADVHRPDRGGPYPVLVQRTPYGKTLIQFVNNQFVKAGYIVVSQDVRGRYESEGQFESFMRFQTHDAEDGYDTVEWAARLPGSNGKVGTLGGSYDGFLQWRLATLQPPSLRAMSAFGTPARLPDEWPHNLRTGRRLYSWVALLTPDMRRRANRPGVHTSNEGLRLWNEGEWRKWIYFLPWSDLPQEVMSML